MAEIITSSKNPRIKTVMALQRSKKDRTESGLFVAEGLRIYKDALRSGGGLIREVYVSEGFYSKLDEAERSELFEGKDVTIVSDSVFETMGETVTPQGVLAVIRQPSSSYEDIVRNGSTKLLILEDVRDPGNLGTMIRTAEAAGMNGVIMSRGTADIFSPKVIRSTMGAVFRVPFMYADDIYETIERLKADGIAVHAAYLHGGIPYRERSYGEREAVLIGNEGNGLTEEAVAHATDCVFIPMAGEVESLNAAVAAALLMYETGGGKRA